MGSRATHVLDTAHGRPGAGMTVGHFATGGGRRLIRSVVTDGDYFRALGVDLPAPPFVDEAVLRIGIADPEARCHVPLPVSPWSYTTYRGS